MRLPFFFFFCIFLSYFISSTFSQSNLSLSSVSIMSVPKPVSFLRSRFHGPRPFMVSLYMQNYASYLDAPHITNVHGSYPALTVRDRYNMLCDTVAGHRSSAGCTAPDMACLCGILSVLNLIALLAAVTKRLRMRGTFQYCGDSFMSIKYSNLVWPFSSCVVQLLTCISHIVSIIARIIASSSVVGVSMSHDICWLA